MKAQRRIARNSLLAQERLAGFFASKVPFTVALEHTGYNLIAGAWVFSSSPIAFSKWPSKS